MEKKKYSSKQLIFKLVVLLSLFPVISYATDPPKIPDGWSEGFVYANGIRIHYYRAVPAPGKPVILAIHGVMDIGLTWASVANKLQDDYNIYMLDTRGHGLSDPFTGSEDSNTLLKDVIGAAEKLGLKNPILMGHSMGGATAIRLGAENPDFARAIIIVDAGIGGPRPQRNQESNTPPPPPPPSPGPLSITMRGTPETLVAQNNYNFDDLVAKAHRDNPRWSMMDCRYWATAIKRYHGPYSEEAWQAMFGTMRTENALAKIQVPMIILKADAPPEVRKIHQEQASVMQHGTLAHIDNSAHNVQRDQPERAAEVIREFLSKLSPGIGTIQQPVPVRTEYGLVKGVTEPGLTIYRGIPFAAPPIGDLRWRPPQPAKPWDGVRDATKFGPDPYQGNGKGNVSEDCLYLNVWTPAKSPDDKIPVLVWIYGGGFAGGHTSGPGENGEYLARKGIVLVSINYRVGPLGFLAHPELSAESPNHVSGNYGLLDQIAGLKWIQKNIAAFGGDPNRVTIFGESAGGISVSMLCATPLAKGLIHGAISESGGSFGPPSVTTYPGENMRLLADAERSGEAYMKKLAASSIAGLRKLAPGQLPGGFNSGVGWPIIDGWVIPDDQYKLYEKGQYNDVPIIVGYNSDEGLTFTWDRTPEDYIMNVHKRFGPFADRLLAAYPPGENTIPRSARNLMRDVAFGWHTWAWARLQSRTGKSKVFYYYFDQHPKRDPNSPEADYGTAHGPEVSYVFQVLKDLHKPGDPELTPADFAISETIATYWTNFAKYGDPNGPGAPEWPRFTEKNREVMCFNDKAFPIPVPDEEGLEALDAYFTWRRTPEGETWGK